jgi:potassium-dependent mechanosensitive channel
MIMRHWLFVGSIFALAGLASAGASAQNPPAPAPAAQPSAAPQADMARIIKRANESMGLDINVKIKSWRTELDQIEQALQDPKLDFRRFNEYRSRLFALRADGEAFWSRLQPLFNSANDEVQALPPAPAQGQPPELEQTAIARTEANARLAYLTSARSSLDSTQNRITKLIGAILDIRQSRITSNRFQRDPGVFSKETWTVAPSQFLELVSKVPARIADWWRAADQEQILPLAAVAFALWLGLSILCLLGVRGLRRWRKESDPPFWRRASSAAGVIFLRSAPTILPLIFLYNAIEQVQAMPEDIGYPFYYAAYSVTIIVAVRALIATVLSPGDHRWRLIPASNAAAVHISGLILIVALVYGAALFIRTAAFFFKAPGSFRVPVTLIPDTIIALLVLAVLRAPLGKDHAEGLPSASRTRVLRLPIRLIAIAIIATGAAGYLSLSRFLTQQLVVTGAILAIVYLFLVWANGISQAMADETSGAGSWLKKTAGFDESRRQRLAVPVSLLLKFLVLLCAVPLILNQWSFTWPDIIEWYRQLFFGFHIGNTQIALVSILAAIVVFILGYLAAKLFQQWLDAQVLRPAGLSSGLRDSISTGVGYIGVFAAALFALSYAGVNLSSLFIVAGAFSVGIGFGLQSVVNNFVSGLIMLAERPVKVGDLVVVGGEEGYVRKISVRSTEIETFDRANVLIPNAFFISEKVKNCTLRNNTGRITLPVSVTHAADPRKVKAILLQVAQNQQGIMSSPPPFVDFEDFGGNTLNFKLYAFIYDLNASINIRTDLRIAILDAFKAAGIPIPMGQTDVNLRDIDWLRDAVKLYVAQTFDGKNAEHARRPAIPAAEPAE